VFCLIGSFFILSSFLERMLGLLLAAPLLVLENSVCCQLIGCNEAFCDFGRTLIAACSKAAFMNLNILTVSSVLD